MNRQEWAAQRRVFKTQEELDTLRTLAKTLSYKRLGELYPGRSRNCLHQAINGKGPYEGTL